MSTGAECHFIERKPQQWYYKIQKFPYGETEEYHTHGPFSSLEKGHEHLHKNYANPGGYSVQRFEA